MTSPAGRTHAYISPHGDDGQVAVLHKKPHIAMAPDDEDDSTSGEQTNAKRYRAEADQSAPAPSACVYKNVPAGTEPPPSSLSADITAARTHLPSCSDKMAKWNVLGLQGRLLTPFFSNRVVVSTIAVGRKFSAPHCARAVCCRLQDLPEGGSVDRKKQRRKLLRGEQAQTVESSSVACLAVHHPVLLSTATKLDESVRDQADAANFTERRCFAAFVDGAQLLAPAAPCLQCITAKSYSTGTACLATAHKQGRVNFRSCPSTHFGSS
jgi:hypothetical protein